MKNSYFTDKKIFKISIIFYIIFLFSIQISSSKSLENKILVKINSEIVTTQDVKNEYKYILALNESFKNIEKKRALEISKRSIVREKIKEIEIINNYKELTVSDEYLKNVLKDLYSNIGLNSQLEFEKYLLNRKISYKNIEKKIKIEALWNSLIYAKFFSKIKIDEEKIKSQLKKDKNKASNSYLLSEILFKISSSGQLEEKFNEIKKTIDSEGFNNAVLAHSISGTVNLGGNLGWINEESIGKKIKQEILKLKKDEYTSPIIVPGGFLILKLNETKKIIKKIDININNELKKIITLKKNEQLNQFSIMHFNKVKKDTIVNEL